MTPGDGVAVSGEPRSTSTVWVATVFGVVPLREFWNAKRNDALQRATEHRGPTTTRAAVPDQTDRPCGRIDGHLARLHIKVGQPVAAAWRGWPPRPALDPTPESKRDTFVGYRAGRVLAARAQVVRAADHRRTSQIGFVINRRTCQSTSDQARTRQVQVHRPQGENNRKPGKITARWPGHMVHLDVKRSAGSPTAAAGASTAATANKPKLPIGPSQQARSAALPCSPAFRGTKVRHSTGVCSGETLPSGSWRYAPRASCRGRACGDTPHECGAGGRQTAWTWRQGGEADPFPPACGA
jgi:hypothetical protein